MELTRVGQDVGFAGTGNVGKDRVGARRAVDAPLRRVVTVDGDAIPQGRVEMIIEDADQPAPAPVGAFVDDETGRPGGLRRTGLFAEEASRQDERFSTGGRAQVDHLPGSTQRE